MTPVYGQDLPVALWVGERIGHPIAPPFTAIGFERGGAFVAGAVFNDHYRQGNIELTFASVQPFTRGMLRVIAFYVFGQLQCTRLTVRTRQANEGLCSLIKRLGFVREATQKDYFGPDQNAEVFRMMAHECRWM